MNEQRFAESKKSLGETSVEMLLRVHQDAMWILENLGVGCKQPDMQAAFRKFEADGLAVIHDGRVYITEPLVEKCLETVTGVDDFFVPLNSFFVGGTAPYIYDDEKGEGGVTPRPEHVAEIARIAQASPVITGMGRGVKLKDESVQILTMAENCQKPMYFAVTNDDSLGLAGELWRERRNTMVVFCLTRPPLEVNENFSDFFVKVVQAGLPVFISAMPLAGISAPFSYNGVLAMTHAEVLFGICAAQLLHPGVLCVHAGFPTVADPRIEYNPNYGLKSHFLLNVLMARLNLMLDIPTFQSAGSTHEEHPTEKAYEDARIGRAICLKYGVHMIRHPFAFLRYLVDFSIEKLKKASEAADAVIAEDAPEISIPVYDERGMDSIRKIGLGMYLYDSLTTSNFGKIFVD